MSEREAQLYADQRLEYELRYRAAAPIVKGSDVWCDIGGGANVSTAAERFRGRLILVDDNAEALAHAAACVQADELTELVADLADEDGLRRVCVSLLPAARGAITCFGVIERLGRFDPLIEFVIQLVEEFGFTAVLSVPNSQYASADSARESIWGEGTVRELQSLLASEHVVAAQVALTGSWITREDSTVSVSSHLRADRTPTHFIVAMGPRSSALGSPVALTTVDLDDQRYRDRQREADLEYYRALVERRSP